MIGLAEWLMALPVRFILKGTIVRAEVYEVSIEDVEVYENEIVVNLGYIRPVPELEDY